MCTKMFPCVAGQVNHDRLGRLAHKLDVGGREFLRGAGETHYVMLASIVRKSQSALLSR